MIKFIRNLNFGYFLLLAAPVVIFVGYANLKNLQTNGLTEPTIADWLKGIGIMVAGFYLIIAGILKIRK